MSLRIPLALCLLWLVSGCAGAGLQGSWVLESTDGRKISEHADRPVKILTEDRFAFGSQTPAGVHAGGGRWEMEDGTYVEVPEYHSLPGLVGRRLAFADRLEGDLWYHEGSFEVDGRPYRIVEVWRRLGDRD